MGLFVMDGVEEICRPGYMGNAVGFVWLCSCFLLLYCCARKCKMVPSFLPFLNNLLKIGSGPFADDGWPLFTNSRFVESFDRKYFNFFIFGFWCVCPRSLSAGPCEENQENSFRLEFDLY